MKILIINGPNLNMLGCRSQQHYGNFTLDDLNQLIKKRYPKVSFKFYQSNSEGKIIDKIQSAFNYDALLINGGGYTHTSVSIRDALEILTIPKASVHLSNYLEREDFRKVDLIKDVVDKVYFGKKEMSYFEAIDYLISCILKN